MTERKLKRTFYRKPYMMDGMFVRSRFEAQQIALASMLTIDQVLQSIRQDPDISAVTWARVDLALKVKQHRESKQTAHKERTYDWGSNIRTRRRIVAVAAAMILVVAFFTLIPSGKTLARGAFDYFANVFENHIKIEPASQAPIHPGYVANDNIDPDETVNEYGEIIIEYDDFESFTDELGLNPIRLTSDDFTLAGITLTKYAATGLSLTSHYTSSIGDIVITQEWLLDGSMSFHSNSDSWESVIILDGIEMLYAIDKADGIFDGIAMLSDSVLWISAQKAVDIFEQLSHIGY
jgi:hypothetical protein